MNRQLATSSYQPAWPVVINSIQQNDEQSFLHKIANNKAAKIRVATGREAKTVNKTWHRKEARIDLLFPMIMSIQSLQYQQTVVVTNISANGAQIILPTTLPIGSRIIVNAFRDFGALAIVRHSTQRDDGSWAIGLKFIKKIGSWAV